MNSNVTECYFL